MTPAGNFTVRGCSFLTKLPVFQIVSRCSLLLHPLFC